MKAKLKSKIPVICLSLIIGGNLLFSSPLKAQNDDETENVGGALFLSESEYASLPPVNWTQLKSTKSNRNSIFAIKQPGLVILKTPRMTMDGQQGPSCVGWAVSNAASILMYPSYNDWTYARRSAAYIYNQIRVTTGSDCNNPKQGCGAYPTDGLNLVKQQGVCSKQLMPQIWGEWDVMPNDAQRFEASLNKVLNWGRLKNRSDVNEIKTALDNGIPVVVAVYMYESYNLARASDGIWNSFSYTEKSIGKHALCIVGYDDQRQMFKVMNSGSVDKADNGFMWFTYNVVKTGGLNEAYTMWEVSTNLAGPNVSCEQKASYTLEGVNPEMIGEWKENLNTIQQEGSSAIFSKSKRGSVSVDVNDISKGLSTTFTKGNIRMGDPTPEIAIYPHLRELEENQYGADTLYYLLPMDKAGVLDIYATDPLGLSDQFKWEIAPSTPKAQTIEGGNKYTLSYGSLQDLSQNEIHIRVSPMHEQCKAPVVLVFRRFAAKITLPEKKPLQLFCPGATVTYSLGDAKGIPLNSIVKWTAEANLVFVSQRIEDGIFLADFLTKGNGYAKLKAEIKINNNETITLTEDKLIWVGRPIADNWNPVITSVDGVNIIRESTNIYKIIARDGGYKGLLDGIGAKYTYSWWPTPVDDNATNCAILDQNEQFLRLYIPGTGYKYEVDVEYFIDNKCGQGDQFFIFEHQSDARTRVVPVTPKQDIYVGDILEFDLLTDHTVPFSTEQQWTCSANLKMKDGSARKKRVKVEVIGTGSIYVKAETQLMPGFGISRKMSFTSDYLYAKAAPTVKQAKKAEVASSIEKTIDDKIVVSTASKSIVVSAANNIEEVYVYSMTGELMNQSKPNSTSCTISTVSFTSGTYAVVVKTANSQENKKVIVI